MENENLWRKCFKCGLPPTEFNLVLELRKEKKYIHHLCMTDPVGILKEYKLIGRKQSQMSLSERI